MRLRHEPLYGYVYDSWTRDNTLGGTRRYGALVVFGVFIVLVLLSTHYDQACDVYSFGVVVWELCTRKLPYDHLEGDNKVCLMIPCC